MNNNIPAKKSLGQNFLKSKLALHKMLEAGEVNNTDVILEVGPGKGVLTEKLLEKAQKVIAVEKDYRLIELLQEKFATEITNGKLELINADILDDRPFIKEEEKSFKIIANIPYYITGQFLRKFLETNHQPSKIVVMVQKEIAQRIVANDKKESLLSISVKVFGTPKMIMKVDKENFSPAPKVDSAILLINNISKKFFTENKILEKDFFKILHAGFAHKRKMLIGNLKEWLKKNPSTCHVDVSLDKIFTEIKLSEKVRAEDITLNDWVSLVQKFTNK
jgi:16S rRNA (adenine1518-N6/adenine1519-N6)-dimethyltransferase